MSGSAFGLGPYGLGRYSRRLTQSSAAVIKTPTRMRVWANATRAAGLQVADRSVIVVAGELMWAPIARGPCDTWSALGPNCGCAFATPNTMASMFG